MIELVVSGMSCAHCVRAITQTIQRQDSQAQVSVDLPGQRVRVSNTTLDLATLQHLVEEEGYSVRPLTGS